MSIKAEDFRKLAEDILTTLDKHPLTRGKDPVVFGFGIIIEIAENEWHGLINNVMSDRDFRYYSDVRAIDSWHRGEELNYKGIRFRRKERAKPTYGVRITPQE